MACSVAEHGVRPPSGPADEAEGFCGLFAAEKLVLLAFEPVIVDEEVFELLDEMSGQVVEFFDVGVHVVGFGDGDEAVVADALFAVELLAFDDADETGADEDSREGGLVHEEENVDGVAVAPAMVRGRKPKS